MRKSSAHTFRPLFTGDAGQGESNIRRYTIENDWLEAVVALLPSPPSTPIETVETGTGRPLDSHNEGADPIPPIRRE